ncbi:SH3 domain-containing protein [Chelativorans sp. Marseille-P2723]|uniref:SH3 domain-containing protein n=1 Tax=Chelativorans sp. Marseille-P2723 TaxID=2709133 RepID=UPI00156D821F|nr:SH3 domain-containing protein [Chelativorans sp. Marseille-P2723]
MRHLMMLFAAALLITSLPSVSLAQSSGSNGGHTLKRGPSGLPLPRFVSLKSGRVNMRVGPGTQYAVEWLYLKPGLPMEIIQEYDNWRRVRDAEGAEGWINQSLLSGRRTGIAGPWFKGKKASLPLFSKPSENARIVAQVEPGALGDVDTCNGEWCRMTFAGHTGWIAQESVWGVYQGEKLAN